MRIRMLTPCLFCLALAACASVPSGDADRDAALKAFRFPSGVAGIYIYRGDDRAPMNVTEIEVDGNRLGRLAPGTYLYVEVPPGRHYVAGKADNVSSVEIEARPGKLYFVRQEAQRNLMSVENRLRRIDIIEGQHEVRRTRLAGGE